MKQTQNNSFDSQQVLSVIEQYSTALDLLDAYDHQTMERPKGNEAAYVLTACDRLYAVWQRIGSFRKGKRRLF